MTNSARRRARRHKLAAHDRGEDRHAKGLSLIKKEQRLYAERSAQPPKTPRNPARPASRPWSYVETEYLLDGYSIREVCEFTGQPLRNWPAVFTR